MSELIKYKLIFPVKDGEINPAQIRIGKESKLTFSINKIKSRASPVVVYFKFYGYDFHGTLICEYTSPRWVVSTEYKLKYTTFEVPYNQIPDSDNYYDGTDLDHYYMELYLIGVDSENPLYFNNIQLNEGELLDYHQPNDLMENIQIGFNNNYYANLYDLTENYLQIIRPYKDDLTTKNLGKSQLTILVPHLPEESTFDDPINIFHEFMNMTEQRIGVEK